MRNHYNEGVAAFARGEPFAAPSGLSSDERFGWYRGYTDAKYPIGKYENGRRFA